MNLKLYDVALNHIIMDKVYPGTASEPENENFIETVTHLDYYPAKGLYKEIYFDGVHIGFGNVHLAHQVTLGFESDFETIEMHFALKGMSSAKTENFAEEVSFKAHSQNIIYANGLCGLMKWESDVFEVCEINLSPKFFKKFLPDDNELFNSFRNSIEKQKTGLLSKYNHPITLEMHQLISDIINCSREGIFKRMFLEAKVIELLMLQLEQFAASPAYTASLRKKDIDKIYAVREFIVNNLNATHSLVDLAHEAGTNEFMLKKGFKELFGTTVFSFWNDLKMEEAKQLLTEHQLNVGEVSYRMGYQNQRNFSAAFKRKYGILPSQLKR